MVTKNPQNVKKRKIKKKIKDKKEIRYKADLTNIVIDAVLGKESASLLSLFLAVASFHIVGGM